QPADPPRDFARCRRQREVVRRPVVLASGMLSVAILASAFEPRHPPAPASPVVAPAAQSCGQHVGCYSPGIDTLNVHGDAFAAFQAEVIGSELDQGYGLAALDFEFADGKPYWRQATTNC
ncbi:MAG: hypothetical protein IT337_08915, partial [Thermomicrobiales bacterium]|nr:hypothetical protein [Thermomicrobiales bacterium]